MGTRRDGDKCLDNAMLDEPMFILLARDLSAPTLVEKWARNRERMIDFGWKPESDRIQVTEARATANAMRDWRDNNIDNGAKKWQASH